jgi:hypothetical protein
MAVSDEQLAAALKAAAEFAVADERYLPLYERVEAEVLARRGRSEALARARSIAKTEHHPVLPSV